MQLTYADASGMRDLEVTAACPDATVGELAAALGALVPGAPYATGDLYVDGRRYPAGILLREAGLVMGSRVAPVGPAPAARSAPAPPAVVVRVVGGLPAGGSIPLPPGTAVVGRRATAEVPLDDPSVSRDHCRLDVDRVGRLVLADLGSRNGTDCNGERLRGPREIGPADLISIGGAVLLRALPPGELGPAVPVDPLREASPGGMIPLTRPPRAAAGPGAEPLILPAKPTARTGPTFSLAALLGPLAMAGAFVAVFGDIRYAAIAGLTPLMFLANYVEAHTKGQRSMRRGVRTFGARLADLREQLAVRRAAEVLQQRERLPDPAELLHRAQAPSPRLWERRAGAEDFLQLSVGTGDLPWAVPVRGGHGEPPAPEVAEALRAASILPQVPVPLDLTAGHVIGLPRAA